MKDANPKHSVVHCYHAGCCSNLTPKDVDGCVRPDRAGQDTVSLKDEGRLRGDDPGVATVPRLRESSQRESLVPALEADECGQFRRSSGGGRTFTLFTWPTCSKLNASRKEKILSSGISGSWSSILHGPSPHPLSFLLYRVLSI